MTAVCWIILGGALGLALSTFVLTAVFSGVEIIDVLWSSRGDDA